MNLFHKKQENDEPVLAVTVSNPVSSGIFEDLLRENEIPYLLRQQGAGGYVKILMGGGVVPDHFYVAPQHLEKARELYHAYLDTEVEDLEEED